MKKMTQELRVLAALQQAGGGWVNGQYFLREMMLSQYHRAIFNLQKRKNRYRYKGEIEASNFTDEHGFKSYRLVQVVYNGMAANVPIVNLKTENINEPKGLFS